MRNKGFTLVELSIVLVIIGLLIGGILVAQSMVGTAKIQALIRQIGQFDAATNNFKTKYNQLPGDNNLMGVVPGNNNGFIESTNPLGNWDGEVAKYWADLSVSGLTNPNGGNYIDDSDGNGSVASDKLPIAVAGNKANIFAYGFDVIGANYYIIGTIASSVTLTPAFKPIEALAIDQKIDDGIQSTGNVKGADDGEYLFTSIQDSINGLCTPSAIDPTYNINYNDLGCMVSIKFDSIINSK